jgi:bifunctional DNA-binding transcriptional regulator/antitoxin component of YhaV-PrlF toxin-antitoxin module
LLQQFEDIFDTECVEPANVPEIHVDLKPEFQEKIFFRPEPLRSKKEQSIIDANAKKLLEQGKAELNPTSIHNLGQVIVPRYDKDGHTIEGRERVCIDARPVNKALVHLISSAKHKKNLAHYVDQQNIFRTGPFRLFHAISNLRTVTRHVDSHNFIW